MRSIISLITIVFFAISLAAPVYSSQESRVDMLEKLIKEGTEAYRNGNFDEALTKLNQAIQLVTELKQKKEKLSEIYITLALTHFVLGDQAKTDSALVNVLEINPDLILDPDLYSPKFIVRVDQVKRENFFKTIFHLSPGADLIVDGVSRGSGEEIELILQKGERKILAKKEGFEDLSQTIQVSREGVIFTLNLSNKEATKEVIKPGKIEKEAAGKKKKKGGILIVIGIIAVVAIIVLLLSGKKKENGTQQADNTGTLYVNSTPEGAIVLLDGTEQGTAPITIYNVSEGSHDVALVKEMYGRWEGVVSIETGKTTILEPTLSVFAYEYDDVWTLNMDWPFSLTMDSSHQFMAVTNDEGKIIIYSLAGAQLAEYPTNFTLQDPKGVWINRDNMLVVSDRQLAKIVVLNSEGKFVRQWGSLGSAKSQFNEPYCIVGDSSDLIYVVDRSNSRIQVFDLQGQFLRKWGSEGSGTEQLDYPIGIAISPNGKVYVADNGNDRISVFSKTGRFHSQWGDWGTKPDQFKSPAGLAIDDHGHVYVADQNRNRIAKFTAEGEFMVNVVQGKGSARGKVKDPSGVTVGPNGKVYVADSANSRVQIFKIAGVVSPYKKARIRTISSNRKLNKSANTKKSSGNQKKNSTIKGKIKG